jgi:hypothetical protein
MNRSSISMSTLTIKSDEGDSLNNGLLFQPTKKESFFLSPPKSLSNNDESIGMKMQTSTLIISTPLQYHYYLYPPTTNRTISNVSINSLSTNSSSSNTSYESQIRDYDDDDTLSCSTYSIINNHQKQVVQSPRNDWQLKPSPEAKPVILSDSVQAFWPPPPPPSLSSDLGQIIMASIAEQVSSLVHLTVLFLIQIKYCTLRMSLFLNW